MRRDARGGGAWHRLVCCAKSDPRGRAASLWRCRVTVVCGSGKWGPGSLSKYQRAGSFVLVAVSFAGPMWALQEQVVVVAKLGQANG